MLILVEKSGNGGVTREILPVRFSALENAVRRHSTFLKWITARSDTNQISIACLSKRATTRQR